MNGKLKLLVITLVGLLGSAPISAQTSAAGSSQPAVSTASADSSYKLGVDDQVRVTVFGEDALTNVYPVGPTGNLSLPLIGDVPAVGRTADQVSAEIREKLADGYIKDPSVSLSITGFRPFNILGEVSKPGSYPYREGMTVIAAVATAQGFTYRAQKKYVFIKHEGTTDEMRTPLTPTLAVEPGDTIRVGERYF